MLDDILTMAMPYYRVGSVVLKVERNFMYRSGPANLFLAFGPYLNDPYMQYVENASIFNDIKQLNATTNMHKVFLEDLVNKKASRLEIIKMAEQVVAEKKLLKMLNLHYPLVLIALAKNVKKDVIDHFEMIGYELLKI